MKKHTPSLLVLGALLCGSVYAADADLTDLQTFAPESKEYKLVYKADLLKGTDAQGNPVYVTDNSGDFAGKKAERLGYYLRLTDLQGGVRRVFVTMKSFTGDVREAGIPRMNPKTPVSSTETGVFVRFAETEHLSSGEHRLCYSGFSTSSKKPLISCWSMAWRTLNRLI